MKSRIPSALAVVAALVFVLAATSPALSASKGSGLPLPRFVSIRSGEANMRTGPGVQYPVEWVYRRPDLPVEIVAEYGTWRKIRDWQGTQGWVHQGMLAGQRTLIVTGETGTIRAKPGAQENAVARVEPGVIGRLRECPDGSAWCRIKIKGFDGWLPRDDFWGAYPDEVVR